MNRLFCPTHGDGLFNLCKIRGLVAIYVLAGQFQPWILFIIFRRQRNRSIFVFHIGGGLNPSLKKFNRHGLYWFTLQSATNLHPFVKIIRYIQGCFHVYHLTIFPHDVKAPPPLSKSTKNELDQRKVRSVAAVYDWRIDSEYFDKTMDSKIIFLERGKNPGLLERR